MSVFLQVSLLQFASITYLAFTVSQAYSVNTVISLELFHRMTFSLRLRV